MEGCPIPENFLSSLVPQISCGLLIHKSEECIAPIQNYTLHPGEQNHDYLVIPGNWVKEIKEHGHVEIPFSRSICLTGH